MNKILSFLSLLDSEGRLSITNLAMYVCLAKLAIAPSASVVDLGALLLSFANYLHKRQTVANTPAEVVPSEINPELGKEVEELKSKVNGLLIRAGMGR